MTEAEWLACDDPDQLYRLIRAESVRRRALIIAECLRLFGEPPPHDPATREGGGSSRDHLEEEMIFGEMFKDGTHPGFVVVRYNPFDRPGHVLTAHCQEAAVAAIMRDIFGNRFRPATLDPAWRTTTVVRFAQAVYDDCAFHQLPILADALEEGGCTDAAILGHCRGPGPHVRGCWVVDLLLGKQ